MRFLLNLCLLSAIPMLAQATVPVDSLFLIIGTYTQNGTSEGMYVYSVDTANGHFNFNHISTASGMVNPSFFVVAPHKRNIYAVSETGDENSGGGVYSLSFDPSTGKLVLLNQQPSGGGAPCFINIDSAALNVLVANYDGGSLSVLPLRPDSTVAAPVQTIQHTGSGTLKGRQDEPHVHALIFSPDRTQLFVTDLGTDRIMIYDYKPENGIIPLSPSEQSYTPVQPGGGPRHFIFHPNGKHAYVVLELSGQVLAFDYADHKLTPVQILSTAPATYKGKNFSSADIHMSPDGKFLYVSNRGDLNNLAIFRIAANGRMTLVGHQSSGGIEPRNFLIDPSGKYLLAANQKSNNVVVFKRNMTTGRLTRLPQELQVPSPACIQLVTPEAPPAENTADGAPTTLAQRQ